VGRSSVYGMNWVDVAIVLLLSAGGVRGFLRGAFRETLGLIGIFAGVVAAEHGATLGGAAARSYLSLPEPVSTGIAFVLIFALVHLLFGLLGGLAERAVVRPLTRIFSGVAGAIVGASTATVMCAFVLLFLHLLPVGPSLDGPITDSLVARPLISVAGTAMRLTMRGSIHAERTAQP
jgi:uncharacterized membrane protein required for colicin V production